MSTSPDWQTLLGQRVLLKLAAENAPDDVAEARVAECVVDAGFVKLEPLGWAPVDKYLVVTPLPGLNPLQAAEEARAEAVTRAETAEQSAAEAMGQVQALTAELTAVMGERDSFAEVVRRRTATANEAVGALEAAKAEHDATRQELAESKFAAAQLAERLEAAEKRAPAQTPAEAPKRP